MVVKQIVPRCLDIKCQEAKLPSKCAWIHLSLSTYYTILPTIQRKWGNKVKQHICEKILVKVDGDKGRFQGRRQHLPYLLLLLFWILGFTQIHGEQEGENKLFSTDSQEWSQHKVKELCVKSSEEAKISRSQWKQTALEVKDVTRWFV